MPSLSLRLALLTTVLAGPVAAGAAPTAAPPPYTNRLIDSADPYLLLHAHNPVDWYPWGPEAFAKARAEGKPIFLSIGYSTCYWCHVAETTIYSNFAIAKLMNQWFVNVKVDREERPDVDRLYMDATTMLDGHGAWPNNLFLTPDGAPFYAGSYFPPKDDGRPTRLPQGARGDPRPLGRPIVPSRVTPAATEMMKALRALAAKHDEAGTLPVFWCRAPGSAPRRRCCCRVSTPSTAASGRRSPAPSSRRSRRWICSPPTPGLDEDAPAAAALAKTLDAMAYGGIDDQLGGGFFRYAT